MSTVIYNALPEILFAHKFTADKYHGCLPSSENKIEITVVAEGQLAVLQNGKKDVAKKGDIICNVYCNDLFVDTDEYHIHKTVGFLVTPDIISRMQEVSLVTHNMERLSVCLFLIDKIIRTYISDSKNTLKISGLFLQLLGELESINRIKYPLNSPGEIRYAGLAKKYIYEHISEPILQKDIANELGITPEYLCAVFKKVEGCSIIRFVNETKLTHIRRMMKSKKLSLNQASSQYGFFDQNYVSKLYKKYYQETITQAIKD